MTSIIIKHNSSNVFILETEKDNIFSMCTDCTKFCIQIGLEKKKVENLPVKNPAPGTAFKKVSTAPKT